VLNAVKAYENWRYSSTIFTSALDGDERSPWRPWRFTPGETAHGTNWTGGWVGLRAGLNILEKRKFVSSVGNRMSAVQHVVHYYTDWATPITTVYQTLCQISSKICDDDILIQSLSFGSFLFKTHRFGDWILSPSSGESLLSCIQAIGTSSNSQDKFALIHQWRYIEIMFVLLFLQMEVNDHLHAPTALSPI
jgi:hypothetical protein